MLSLFRTHLYLKWRALPIPGEPDKVFSPQFADGWMETKETLPWWHSPREDDYDSLTQKDPIETPVSYQMTDHRNIVHSEQSFLLGNSPS